MKQKTKKDPQKLSSTTKIKLLARRGETVCHARMTARYHDDSPSNLIENDVISMSTGRLVIGEGQCACEHVEAASLPSKTNPFPECVTHACDNATATGRGAEEFPWGTRTPRSYRGYAAFTQRRKYALSRSHRDNYCAALSRPGVLVLGCK